jgi:cobalt-zinc-cadmium efflux system outer membrane protein
MNVAQLITIMIIIFPLLMSSGAANAAKEQTLAGGEELNSLIAQALDRNPDLKAAEARWRSFTHKIVPAASLDDPRLSLSLNNFPTDSFAWDQTPMTGETVRLSQALPFPGKLAAKKEVAAQQAAWYEEMYQETRIDLSRQVKDSWYTLFFKERNLEQIDASLKLLDDLILLTESRYETGMGMQQDVLKAQVERSILTERRLNIEQQRQTVLAGLNSLRAMPADTPVSIPTTVNPEPLPDSKEQLLEKAVKRRPMAKAYRALIAQYQAQGKLARLNFLPDFSVGAAYTFRQSNPLDNGVDFASVEFGLSLPLFREKRKESEAESTAGEAMARQQLDDFINRTRFAISDAHSQMKKNTQLVNLYSSGIIPQAKQTLEAAISGYQVGKISVLALLDTALTLYRYEVEYFRALSDLGRDIAKLEAEAALYSDSVSNAGQIPRPLAMIKNTSPEE